MSARQTSIVRRVTWKFDAKPFLEDTVSGATGAITLMPIEAKTIVKSVKAYVKTPVTGATSEIVGDSADDNGWLIDGFAAAAGFFPKSMAASLAATEFPGALARSGDAELGKFYNTANAITLTLAGTATAGEIDFYIEHVVLE